METDKPVACSMLCEVAQDIALIKERVEEESSRLRAQVFDLTQTNDLGIITGVVDSISGRNFIILNGNGKFWHQLCDNKLLIRLDLALGQEVKVRSIPISVFDRVKKTNTVKFQVTHLEKL